MEDFVDEKEQWEEVQGWFRANGPWIVAGVIVGAAVLAGWHFYQERVDRRASEAAGQYAEILNAYGIGEPSKAATQIAVLERDHAGSPYVDQAHLAAARMAVESNDLDRAASQLRTVMTATHDPELALIARLRLARVLLAQGKFDDALATVRAAPAATAFAPAFAEVRGDALLAKGDRAGALSAYREASSQKSADVADTSTLELKMRDLASP